MSQLPSYETLADALQQAKLPYTPAELHGLLSGLLAVAQPLSDAAVLARLASHVGAARWPAALIDDWKACRNAILSEYQDEGMSFALLLPSVDDLGPRAEALAAWCEGFLAGFGEMVAAGKLPALVNEALADLMAISRLESPAGESEEEAAQLAQIEEHCRMVALAVFTEMVLAGRRKTANASADKEAH